MKSSILKLNKYLKKTSTDQYSTNGKIFIDSKFDIGKELALATDSKKQPLGNRKSDADNTNLDWPRMYTHSDKSASPLNDYHSAGAGLSTHYNDTPSTSLAEYSVPEKNFIQGNLLFFKIISSIKYLVIRPFYLHKSVPNLDLKKTKHTKRRIN